MINHSPVRYIARAYSYMFLWYRKNKSGIQKSFPTSFFDIFRIGIPSKMICYILAKIYIIITCVPTGFIFYIFINIIPGSYIVVGKSYMFLWYRKNTAGIIENHFPDFYDGFWNFTIPNHLKHAGLSQISGWPMSQLVWFFTYL